LKKGKWLAKGERMNIFKATQNYCDLNYLIDLEDKIPIFLASVGSHIFNSMNKCATCDFTEGEEFVIEPCPMRHPNAPFYTPGARAADTRLHILMRGMKGSGKSILIDTFLAQGTGLLWNAKGFKGEGFRTMIGPNSVTEAGMFGSVNEDGIVVGRPLAREMCGGFLGFEEFSSLVDAGNKDHSTDMMNQMLTSTDNGRVNKSMRSGWVRYTTRYTVWGGTQPGRFELESGLDRRFFIIDIDMNPQKELAFKRANQKQANMSHEQRLKINALREVIRRFLLERQMEAILNPPVQVRFGQDVQDWLENKDVRSWEADLFRRLMLGYWMMQETYNPMPVFEITINDELRKYLDDALRMRRTVMDADMELIKSTFWNRDMPKSTLVKEVAKMVTNGDYQTAKRWIEESLEGNSWYKEFKTVKEGRGRKGVMCRIGYDTPPARKKPELQWGEWSGVEQ
jgi:hypothetical protein